MRERGKEVQNDFKVLGLNKRRSDLPEIGKNVEESRSEGEEN